MRAIEFTLPIPPSVNRYWRLFNMGGFARVILSKDGRKYKDTVRGMIYKHCQEHKISIGKGQELFTGRVGISVMLCPRNKKACDIDNYLKASLDALTAAHVWVDDSQIDSIYMIRGAIKKGGELKIQIREL